MFATRRIEFSASHVCRNAALSESENYRIYGASANPHGHGHNFVVDVTLDGMPDPVTGMIFDLKDLKEILNREVPPFDTVVPTPENIAIEIWRRTAPYFEATAVRLHAVRVYETEDLYVEYFGDGK